MLQNGGIICMYHIVLKEAHYMLNIGDRAPDFTLCDDIGKQYSLDDFAGKTLVLYFYPKDNTPGCTRQAWGGGGRVRGVKNHGAGVWGLNKK